MKKLISVTLVLLMLICGSMFSASAEAPFWPSDKLYGDANNNRSIDIFDVTFIQKFLAELQTFNRGNIELSDVDDDGEVTVIDATMIQQKLAGIIDEFPAGDVIDDYFFRITYIDVECENDYPVQGETINFVVETDEKGWTPLTYYYYIDDELVCVSDSNVFSYTCNEVGFFTIDVYVYNTLDFSQSKRFDVVVKEAKYTK